MNQMAETKDLMQTSQEAAAALRQAVELMTQIVKPGVKSLLRNWDGYGRTFSS